MSYDINQASQDLRGQLEKEPSMDLDHLFTTIKDLKAEREKKLKQDFELQKEVTNLRVAARGSGFDVEYDPSTNTLRNLNMQAQEPPKITAERGVQLDEPQLENYIKRTGLTREQALKKLEGGMTTVETGSRVPQKPGDKPLKPEIDPASEAVIDGFKQGMISKAKSENSPAKAKPLTESQRTAISYQSKVTRMVNKVYKVLPKANRVLASAPKEATTIGKFGSKFIPGKKGKEVWKANDNAEALRDYFDQLKATIPFAKGGKALTEVEKQILFKLLEYGPSTSMETIKRNLREFKVEYTNMGKLAQGEGITNEDELSDAAAKDIEDLRGQVNSQGEDLKGLIEEYDLE